MNLAFLTILFVIFLLPGFCYENAYHSGNFSKKYVRTTVFSNLGDAVLPAILIHVFLLCIIHTSETFPDVSLSAIGSLMFGANDDATIHKVFTDNIGYNLNYIYAYLLTGIAIGYISGFTIVSIVRKLYIDLLLPWFRFDNEWYYVLKGEILGWRETKFLSDGITNYLLMRNRLTVVVKVLSDVSGEPYIYEGMVDKFFLNKKGLDSLYLKYCTRFQFPKNQSDVEETYFDTNRVILGDDIIIPWKNILNIDIDYLIPEQISYRKLKSSTVWHFCTNCSNWPTLNFEEAFEPPNQSKICNQCETKYLNRDCEQLEEFNELGMVEKAIIKLRYEYHLVIKYFNI